MACCTWCSNWENSLNKNWRKLHGFDYLAKADSDKYAKRTGNPVVEVRAAVEGGLDELNNGAKGACPEEHWS